MRETIDYLKSSFHRAVEEGFDVAKMQMIPFAIALLAIALVLTGATFVDPGWLTYGLSVPPALFILGVSYIRVNAIGPEAQGIRWHLRRMGLILCGTGSAMLLATPFLETPLFPTWRAIIVLWGISLTWLTTPGQPPFWRYWSGEYKGDQPPRSPLSRMLSRLTSTNHDVAALEEALKEAEAQDRADQHRRRKDDL